MKIHILCDSPKTHSGFSVVGKNIALGLKNLGHEIYMTGFQTSYESEFIKDELNSSVIEVMPITVQYIDELSQYLNNIQKVNPDVAICIFNGDDSQQNQFAKAVKPCCWYVPIEGRNIPEFMINDLTQVGKVGDINIRQVGKSGKIIAQCNWGKNEMLGSGIESTVIYHGYNPEIFKNIRKTPRFAQLNYEKINLVKYNDNKWTANKVELRYLSNELAGKFVFGFVGANHGIRKKIERLLKAYSIFLKDNKRLQDRTLLVLRTMPISITGVNLIKICHDLGISSNVVFLYGDDNKLSDESMNIVYNCFDIHISASGSEGFGLPILESMACGIPQIGTGCSSFIELIRDYTGQEKHRGLIADKGLWHMIPDGSERFLVDEFDLSEKMHTMYAREEFREFCGKNAGEWVKQFTWDKIINQWDEVLKNIST